MPGRKHPSQRSRAERDKLVRQWLYLPDWVVSRYRPRLQPADREDVISMCYAPLMRAAELWDASKGVLFKTYAIRAIILQLPPADLPGVITYPRFAKYREALALAKRCVTFSGDQEPESSVYSRDDPVASAEHRDDCKALKRAMRHLTAKERYVIRGRFWRHQLLQEIGDEMGLTRERVRQLEREAVEKLTGWMNGKA